MSLFCALAFLYWPSFRPWFPRKACCPVFLHLGEYSAVTPLAVNRRVLDLDPWSGYVGWTPGRAQSVRALGPVADLWVVFLKLDQDYDNQRALVGPSGVGQPLRLAGLHGLRLVFSAVKHRFATRCSMTETAVILCLGESWNTNRQWWFVDGLFAFGPCCGPASLSWVFGTITSPRVSRIRLLPTLRSLRPARATERS